jgi:hypothetical protein
MIVLDPRVDSNGPNGPFGAPLFGKGRERSAEAAAWDCRRRDVPLATAYPQLGIAWVPLPGAVI